MSGKTGQGGHKEGRRGGRRGSGMRALRAMARDYPGRFVPLDSWAVRAPAGYKAVLVLVLSLSAFWARTVPLAGGLFAIVAMLYLVSGLGRALRRDALLFVFQFPLLLILYLLALDTAVEALTKASIVAAQISCAVLPGLWLQRTTSPGNAANALQRVLPGRAAFVLFTSLRFFPVILRDAKQIHAMQVLRGAPVRPRQLVSPRTLWRAWPALATHVGMPVMVRALKVAHEASLSARARGLDRAEHIGRAHGHVHEQTRESSGGSGQQSDKTTSATSGNKD